MVSRTEWYFQIDGSFTIANCMALERKTPSGFVWGSGILIEQRYGKHLYDPSQTAKANTIITLFFNPHTHVLLSSHAQ